MSFECETLAGCQNFSYIVDRDCFEYSWISGVRLQDPNEEALRPHEMCDELASREGFWIAPVTIRGWVVIDVECSGGYYIWLDIAIQG